MNVLPVPFAIFPNDKTATAGGRWLSRGPNEIGRRRGENLAGTCRVQHSVPDESGVKRLVSGAPAGQQSNLAWREMPALHEPRRLAHTHDIGMRRTEYGTTFAHRRVDVVDQLLHPGPPR